MCTKYIPPLNAENVLYDAEPLLSQEQIAFWCLDKATKHLMAQPKQTRKPVKDSSSYTSSDPRNTRVSASACRSMSHELDLPAAVHMALM